MPDRHRQPRTMNDDERRREIARLRRLHYTWAQVGAAVNLSANGAKYVLHRRTHPGRYDEVCEEEVDPVGAGEEDW